MKKQKPYLYKQIKCDVAHMFMETSVKQCFVAKYLYLAYCSRSYETLKINANVK
jgi:hypothetical protein